MDCEFAIENITAYAELGHKSSVSMEIGVNVWCRSINTRTINGRRLKKLFDELNPSTAWLFRGDNPTNLDYKELLDIVVTHMEWTRPYHFKIEGYIPSPTRVNLTTNTWHQDTIDYINKYIIDDTNNTKKMFEEEVMGNTSKKFTAQDEHIRHANFRLSTLGIKKVIFNQNATIVIFNNGHKSVVKASENDYYSKEAGVALALLKDKVGDECFHYVLQALSGGKGDRVFDRNDHYIEIDDRNANSRKEELLGFFANLWKESLEEVNENDSEEK